VVALVKDSMIHRHKMMVYHPQANRIAKAFNKMEHGFTKVLLILWELREVLTSTCNPDKNRIF
jgi:hypothetical protein